MERGAGQPRRRGATGLVKKPRFQKLPLRCVNAGSKRATLYCRGGEFLTLLLTGKAQISVTAPIVFTHGSGGRGPPAGGVWWRMAFRGVALDDLIIDDDEAFAALPLYEGLKRTLRASGHRFLVPSGGAATSWDRTLFLNLTFWSAEEGTDVLCDDHIPADVVAHAAWHHVVGRELERSAGRGSRSAAGLFLAESIASAFDLYLVGRLLSSAPDTDFIATQVPIMQEAAAEAGLSGPGFQTMLQDVCADPERAFEDLRALLFDVTTALAECHEAVEASRALERYEGHRFAPLLHHYQLSNWILYARAYAEDTPARVQAVRGFDEQLRRSKAAVTWLAQNWIDSSSAAPQPASS